MGGEGGGGKLLKSCIARVGVRHNYELIFVGVGELGHEIVCFPLHLIFLYILVS